MILVFMSGDKFLSGLEDIPQWFADYFAINLASAQTILSIMLILTVTLPVLYLSRGKGIIPIMVFFMVMCVCVGIGWLNYWVLIATMVVGAIAVSIFGTNAITGE